jgi:hypothetical protein
MPMFLLADVQFNPSEADVSTHDGSQPLRINVAYHLIERSWRMVKRHVE